MIDLTDVVLYPSYFHVDKEDKTIYIKFLLNDIIDFAVILPYSEPLEKLVLEYFDSSLGLYALGHF